MTCFRKAGSGCGRVSVLGLWKQPNCCCPHLTCSHIMMQPCLSSWQQTSQYGLGAVISYVLPDGVERPVAFASRSLSSSERNYSQIDKEALALVYGVKKFQAYLYGRKFTLVTDHKPLTSIFGPRKGVPAARLQRWSLLLSAYNYDIEFRPTAAHGNADALSRLPLPEGGVERPSERHLYNIHQLEMLPITSQKIKKATQRDPVLRKILSYMMKGWPVEVPKSLQPYRSKLAELSVEDDCLLWVGRVVIPESLQKSVLAELHREHMGISKMKALARSHVRWSGLDKDLEAMPRLPGSEASTRKCTVAFGRANHGNACTSTSLVRFWTNPSS